MPTLVRASSANSAASGTAISVAAPAGTTVGDLVLVFITDNADSSVLSDNNGTTPFTEHLDGTHGTPGVTRYGCYSRRIQAGDPTTYNFTSAATGRWGIIAVAIMDPDPNVIFDVSPVAADSGAASTTMTAPSINILTPGALHFIAGLPDGAGTTITATPVGYDVDQNSQTNQSIVVVHKTIASGGATGTQDFTLGTSAAYNIMQCAVKNMNPSSGSLLLMNVG
jgi:hypothetical protein